MDKNISIDVKNTKEYIELQNLFTEEKNKNNILSEQNKKLENDLNKLKIELEYANKNIKDLTKKLSNNKIKNKKKIIELQKSIDMKNLEINQLNARINNNNDGIICSSGDKIVSIAFNSVNQIIQNYNRAYKDTEIFSRIEEELYNEYPEFKDKETYLMIRANKIQRFKTLRENNIKNGDVIQVHIYDDDDEN